MFLIYAAHRTIIRHRILSAALDHFILLEFIVSHGEDALISRPLSLQQFVFIVIGGEICYVSHELDLSGLMRSFCFFQLFTLELVFGFGEAVAVVLFVVEDDVVHQILPLHYDLLASD